jgi:hypothetical protein
MMSFRGFHWIYDVTEADEKTRARTASFARRLHRAGRQRLNAHRRVTRRQSRTPSHRVVSIRALTRSASACRRRTASQPFLVTAFGNSSGSPDPELSAPPQRSQSAERSQ